MSLDFKKEKFTVEYLTPQGNSRPIPWSCAQTLLPETREPSSAPPPHSLPSAIALTQKLPLLWYSNLWRWAAPFARTR
jgi:hypothetical protein